MNELGGFIVLSGSLFPLLIWFFVSIILAGLLSRLFKTRAVRLFGGIGLFVLIFMLPLADEIVGRLYFNYLCDTQTGIKVYQTVELPAEYWNEDGKPKFYDEMNGNFLLDGYGVEYKTGSFSSLFHIDNAGYSRVDKRSGKLLGETTEFRYWGGWMKRNLSPHNVAISCENRSENSFNLIKNIFKQKKP